MIRSMKDPVQREDLQRPMEGPEGRMRIKEDGRLEQCRALRDVIPPTPPGPEGSNGNGSLRCSRSPGTLFKCSGEWQPGTSP